MRWSSRRSPTTRRSSPGDVDVTRTPVADAADPRLDDYRALNDQTFRRRYEGDRIFIAEGYVAVDRLLESVHIVRSVLLSPSRVERFATNASVLAARGVPVFVAERDVIAEVVGFDLHRGVLACAERRAHLHIEDLCRASRRIAVLEGLNDAENLGAISRAARAFGIDGMVIDPTCTDPYSRRTVRVSMGEVLTLPVARAATWPDDLGTLGANGFELWAMTPDAAAEDLWEVDVPDKVAVMFGAEGPGLSRAALAAADRRVRIPIAAAVDSLNVAQAAAVTFAALARPPRPDAMSVATRSAETHRPRDHRDESARDTCEQTHRGDWAGKRRQPPDESGGCRANRLIQSDDSATSSRGSGASPRPS